MSLFSDSWSVQHLIAAVVVVVGLIVIAIAAIWLRRLRARRLNEGIRAAEEQRRHDRRAQLSEEATRRVCEAPEQRRREASEHPPAPTSPAPQAPMLPGAAARERAARTDLAAFASRKPDPSTPEGALAIEAGRLAYQVPDQMWLGVQETVEVRLGALIANEFMQGFVGRGDVKLENVPIVETMSVSLVCEPGAFGIEARSQEVQLVKPDLVKGTAFHQSEFARWTWLVTPRQRGKHTLLVKVSAALRDGRGLPTTSSLPDKIIAVSVRVHLARAAVGAVGYLAPLVVSGVVTALVGIFTKDYWWPAIRSWLGV